MTALSGTGGGGDGRQDSGEAMAKGKPCLLPPGRILSGGAPSMSRPLPATREPAAATPTHLGPLVQAEVLEALGVAAVVFAEDGRIVVASRAAAELVGEAPGALSGLSSAGWEALLLRGFAPVEEQESDAAAPDAGEAAVRRWRLESRAAPLRVLLRERREVRLPGGRVVGAVEVLRDLSELARLRLERERERERHHREMEALRLQLASVERYKVELTANVTHDLRTPLAAIKASVSGLLAGDVEYDPAAVRDTLQLIDEETDRLQRRVQNLLSMSRIEAGDDMLHRDWVDVADLVGSALESLRSLAGKRPIVVELPPDLPLLQADHDQLLIALRNLLENALLYSPPDQAVEVSAAVTLGQLRLRVRDRGAGLMPDEFERVFEKFYRGRSARRIPGTGLGLPICRRIAEAHGGRLWAEHAAGGGVAFVLSIPVDPHQESTAALSNEALPGGGFTPPPHPVAQP
jgi:signal transduction histidine kinase